MFGRKTKNKDQSRGIRVQLGDKVLFDGSLEDMQLKDEWIVKKSIEFFDDPEPCFIHRSAVAVRLLNEIWDSAGNESGAASEYADYPAGAVIKRK